MPWFDLKNATMTAKDGTSGTAAVNNASGYTIAAVTMAIDGYTGIIAVGQTLKFGSDVTVYTVTGHTETSGNTTSITFTPGLVVATTDNEVITLQPKTLTIKIGEGNMTYGEKRAIEYKKNRGKLDPSGVRLGDEEPLDVSFDILWENITASSGLAPTMEDVLKQRGEASTWVSTAADSCTPYSIDIEIDYTPPCSTIEKEKILLKEFRYESLPHDLKAGNISVTGKCNHTEALVTRVTAF